MLYLASADGDYFCDALEEIYSTFKATGAKMVGHWPAEGYEHEDSKARSCCSRLGALLIYYYNAHCRLDPADVQCGINMHPAQHQLP